MKGVIAKIDWWGCHACFYSDPKDGGCSVDEQEIADNIEIDMLSETVSCGCFKEREQ